MPGRTSPFQTSVSGMSDGSDSYRYGFNGKENDFEPKNGQGTQQDYGLRIYDPRLGKFLSVDPITKNYPMLTPYQYASNRPIDGIDWDGLEHRSYLYKEGTNGKTTLLSVVDYTETKTGTGPLGAGIEVTVISKNGETKWVFVPDKKAEKTVYQEAMDGPDAFGGYMEQKIRPGNSTTYSMEGADNGPIQSAEAGAKVSVQAVGVEATATAKVSDVTGTDKAEVETKSEFSTQATEKFSYNIKGYLKLNFDKPIESVKVKATLNLSYFYIQATTNMQTGKFESLELGAQAKPSAAPSAKITVPQTQPAKK